MNGTDFKSLTPEENAKHRAISDARRWSLNLERESQLGYGNQVNRCRVHLAAALRRLREQDTAEAANWARILRRMYSRTFSRATLD